MGWLWSGVPSVPEPATYSESVKGTALGDQRFSGLFWTASPESRSVAALSNSLRGGQTKQAKHGLDTYTPQECPVDHTKLLKKSKSAPLKPPHGANDRRLSDQLGPADDDAADAAKCPIDHKALQAMEKRRESGSAARRQDGADEPHVPHLNPLNNMPTTLSSQRAPGQVIDLPTERTISSIPKGATGSAGNWEYPSPQQMLNAMIRKSGREGIDEDAVESMVDVHNFLNEGVWREVLEWERPYSERSQAMPRLLKFTGRPGDLSPRAAMFQMLGKIWPSQFGFPPPFDRHDWTVLRKVARTGGSTEPDGNDAGSWQQVRYVIDFYEAPDEGDMPAFSVDVRPALDSFQSAADLLRHSALPLWEKAMGR